jgi:hypothetical protein
VSEKRAILVGNLIGVLLSFVLSFFVVKLLSALEISIVPLTILTILALIYLSLNKKNGTGKRTKWILKVAEKHSIVILIFAGMLITLREGLEIGITTIGLLNISLLNVYIGIILGILPVVLLVLILHKSMLKLNKVMIFKFCNYSFIAMALYYGYEVLCVF